MCFCYSACILNKEIAAYGRHAGDEKEAVMRGGVEGHKKIIIFISIYICVQTKKSDYIKQNKKRDITRNNGSRV